MITEKEVETFAELRANRFAPKEKLRNALTAAINQTRSGRPRRLYGQYVLDEREARERRYDSRVEAPWPWVAVAYQVPYIEATYYPYNDPQSAMEDKLELMFRTDKLTKRKKKEIDFLFDGLKADEADIKDFYRYVGDDEDRYGARWGTMIQWDTVLHDVPDLTDDQQYDLRELLRPHSREHLDHTTNSTQTGILHMVSHDKVPTICGIIGDFHHKLRNTF